jgi:anion-transporting  ArsA/GET3 family ATPase
MSAKKRSAKLRQALRTRRVVVVCGSGGVGKTTLSAVLALQAAREGRRVLVCTVDPSRRLATSLGLRQLSERPRLLPTDRLGGLPAGAGLWAMTLDTKHTFDALVERYTPDETARRRILDNRFYKHISAALAGTHEYMAMEKLLDLAGDERYDLVVLDTPPTRHALDFLEAPDRLLGFLDASILRFFLRPYFAAGRLTLQVATRAGRLALDLADRVLGLQFLQDLSEFFLAFESMYDGFKERAGRVFALLREPSSGFVLVTGPGRPALDEALYFYRRLREKGMPFVSFLVNRVHPDPGAGRRRTPRSPRPAQLPDAALGEALLRLHAEQRALHRADTRHVARLLAGTREDTLVVPELDTDVHDLRGLSEVARLVFEGAAPARAAEPEPRVRNGVAP